ncbi:Uncharacterised protein [Corynebacterium cystitidis]|nr:Uncharacterised protein [Corynebacterium cystitidis]
MTNSGQIWGRLGDSAAHFYATTLGTTLPQLKNKITCPIVPDA